MDKAEALRIIAAASLRYPRLGWDEVNKLTDFQGRIMNRPGGSHSNFMEALADLALSRDDAVDAFIRARRAPVTKDDRTARTETAEEQTDDARPAAGRVVPAQPVVTPAPAPARPAPDRPPQPERLADPQPGPRPDPRPHEGRGVPRPSAQPAKPPRRQPVKAEPPKPEDKQSSLF